MLGIGVHLLIWPAAMGASSFRLLLLVIGDVHALTAFFIAVGMFRAFALIANGKWHIYGSRIRAFSALLSGVVWLQLAIALVLLIPAQGTPPSPGIPVYTVLFLAELYSTYRAASDGRFGGR
jgi:hypothetical protein